MSKMPSSIEYSKIDGDLNDDDEQVTLLSSENPQRQNLEVDSVIEANDSRNEDYDDEILSGRGNGENIVRIDDAIESIGYGRFQKKVLLAVGLCFAADSMEVMLLSFLSLVLQAEWGLTERQTATITSSVFAGQLAGTLCLGHLGDRIGRRPIFCVAATIIFVFGLTTSLATNFETLVAMRFAVGFGVGGASVPFDVFAEFLPNTDRGKNLLYIEYFWTAGTLSVPLLARYSIGDGTSGGSWQLFVILCALPCLGSAILGVMFVPESPRWLLVEGRSGEAMTVLRRAAKENGHDPHVLFPKTMQLEAHDEEESGVCDLLAPRWRKISFALWAVYFGYSFAYYGTILAVTRVFDDESTSTAQVGGDAAGYNFNYSAILKSSAGEVFGVTLVVMLVDRVGRVPSQMFCYAMGGLSVFTFCWYAAYENSPRSVLVLLAFLVRAFEMGSSCVTVVSTPELLPTKLRTTGHSVASAIARLGALLCPFLVAESTPMKTIGAIMLCIHIVTVLGASQFPETSGLAMGRVKNV